MPLSCTTWAKVFSAHAEVVPVEAIGKIWDGSILRARGGSSSQGVTMIHQIKYSPRTRR